MCDCFHLAFPNWHGPATGAGRRLRGPEQDTEDYSVCEEPGVLEGERPRPQGSSPVEEFPTEKQAEEDTSTSPHKSGGNKKIRRLGLGSLFDKRSPAKMSEDIQSDEAEVIVKTVKETGAEGLVVTGGGKEGIFIKEVKPDSPASKHLTIKEGDQILSATVFFDNMSYEDALQILEHAQPYKMEFCLRRKMESTMPEDDALIHPEDNEKGSPQMRSPRKKKQQDRISWPKFPSFGNRAQFKRSHSTSEAEEHKKLEMSPPTSDTESPLKAPLKSPDGKDKKKKQKMKMKMKMKGQRSKSVEEPQGNEKELASENLIVLEVGDTLEEKFPEESVTKLAEIPQENAEAEHKDLSKIVTEHEVPSLTGRELQHKAHLINLGSTLKTTDISDALAEVSGGDMTISVDGKIERSEFKFSIPQKDTSKLEVDGQSKTLVGISGISDTAAFDTIVVSHGALSHVEGETSQLDTDINTEVISKDSSEKNVAFGKMDMSVPKLDVSVDSSGVGVPKQSPRDVSEKQWKEKTIFENEIYGIKTRGPLADIAISRSHFTNGLQYIPPDSSEMIKESIMPETITVISQPELNDLSVVSAVDVKDSHLKIKTSKPPTYTNIHEILEKKSESKFKLPKVDGSGILIQEPIKRTKAEQIKTHLPKREDIEIPGMEDNESKPSLQTPGIKVPKIEKIINISKEREIQARRTDEEFNVEDVKEAVSKFPSFKLPEGDITGVLVQREITIMEMKSDKTGTTPRGSPRKISSSSAEEKSSCSYTLDKDTLIKIPKVEPPYDEPTITMTMIDYTKPKGETQQTKTSKVLITSDAKIGDVKFKLPKREDIEIPGMESIEESVVKNIDMKVIKDPHQAPDVHQPSVQIAVQSDIEKSERHKTKKYGDKKEQEKKSKKPKISMPSFGITKPDIRFPDFGIEVPKKDAPSKKDTGEIMETQLEVDVPHTDIKHKDASPDSKGHRKETTMEWKTTDGIRITVDNKTELLNLTEFDDLTVKAPKAAEESSVVDVQDTKFKLLAMSPSAGIKYPEEEKGVHSVHVDGKAHDSKTEAQGRKFKLPKFEISLPEVKAPKLSPSKKDDDILRGDRKTEVPAGQGEMAYGQSEKEADILEQDSKSLEIKMQRPTFSFPKFGFSRSESKEKEADVSLPRVDVSIPKDRTDEAKIRVSKSKDKTPETKMDTSGVEVLKAEPPSFDAELKLLAEPTLESDIKPDLHKDKEMLSVDVKAQDIQTEGQSSKFKLPKFGIKLPEMKTPKIDLSGAKSSLSENKADVHTSGKADVHELESKSEVKTPDAKVSLINVDVPLPEASTDLKEASMEFMVSAGDTDPKNETKFVSPTKFKLPSITIPKFGAKAPKGTVDISSGDIQVTGPEISLPEAELELIAEPLSVDIKGPGVDLDKSHSVDMKAEDIQIEQQGRKFKLPKFGIGLPEVKGPKIDSSTTKTEIDITLPEVKAEGHPPDVKVTEGATELKADMPEIDSKGLEVKTKGPSFSFPKFGFSKSEIKAPEVDPGLPTVDVSVPEGSIDLKETATVSTGDLKQTEETKFGSPTKFKLPSITMPHFGAKTPKGTVESFDVDVQAKGPEISLPDAEVKLSTEPLSVEITGPHVELDKSLSVDTKAQDIQTEELSSKFKLPKFGISLPEVKGPKITAREIDVSLPEGNVEVHPPDFKVTEGTIEIKSDITSKGLEVKTKEPSISLPKFGFSKSEMKAPEVDPGLPTVDVSLPEETVKLEDTDTEIKISMDDIKQKEETKLGSPTKFKLPSITLPKFGAKAPKGTVESSAVDVQAKGPEISLPDAEVKWSTEPLSVEIKGPDVELDKSHSVDMKPQDIQTEKQDGKFKLPKFGFNINEVEGPKIGSTELSVTKTETDISLPEGKTKVHPPEIEVQEGAIKVKAEAPEIHSKSLDVKTKRPSFSFPKFGFAKIDMKAPEADVNVPNVDVSVAEGAVDLEGPTTEITATVGGTGKKDKSTFGSPTKFKLPSISLPKIGAKAPKVTEEIASVDVQVKGPEISLPEAKLELLTEPLSVDIKRPEVEIEEKSHEVDIKNQEIQLQEQGSKFKLPKFGISLPEVKGPKIDLSATKAEADISLPKGKMEVCSPETKLPEGAFEVKAEIPETESKGLDMKIKGPSFTFPKFGFSKSEMKAPEADASLPVVGVSLPEGNVDLEGPKTDITLSMDDTEQKDETKFGSPTKFKLPSFTLPKFGAKAPKGTIEISTADVQGKDHDISLPEAELKLSAEPLSVDIKGPDVELEKKSLSVDINSQDIQIEQQGSKFKLPKFGISLPEVKGPKTGSSTTKAEIDVSLPEGKMEVCPPDTKQPEGVFEVKAEIPEIDSKSLDVKTKGPSFSFPKFGFSKSEVKAPEADASLPIVEGSLDLEGPKTDITLSMGDTEQKDEKFGSPTKFKLPSFTLPKFGVKAAKGKDIPDVDIQAKGPEISLSSAELKLSAKLPSVDTQQSETEKEEKSLKGQNIQMQEQGSKFKLPKFGISLPEVKGSKVDLSTTKTEIDISLPEGKMEVHPADTKLPEKVIEVKADMPEMDSEGLDVKIKGPSFSFPKFGFSKSEAKDLEADASLPVVDVSLPEANVDLEGPKTDITLSMGDTEQKDEKKFGSPTKFKLPTITLPKFGVKAPKGAVEMSSVDIQAQGHDISLPEAELKVSAEPLSVDIKGPDVELDKSHNVDMKCQDIQTEKQGSKFKLPKFGISLPEVKGPKVDSSTTKTGIDISLPEGKMEVQPPDTKLPESIKVKADVPEMDSKGLNVKTKGPSFSFPKFGFSKSEMKAPEADTSLPVVDVSLTGGNIDLQGASTDITLSVGDTEQKDETKFGSPTKFKLPTITLPKFGAKVPKGKGDIPAVDLQTGQEISLPDAELKLSAQLPSVENKGPDVEKEEKSLKVDMKAKNIETEKQGSKFKLPKFGISLPEVKAPEIGSSSTKTEIDVSLPEGKMEMHPPDTELPEKVIKVKTGMPEIDSTGLDVKTKGASFSFPKFGFSKSEMKAPEADASIPVVDVSLPEANVDLEGPKTDITLSMDDTERKDETKFGSPTKFKLPTITLPKFGAKAPKVTVESSAVDVQAKGPEISLPDAEVKLSTEPLSVEIKGTDVELDKSLSVDMKTQDIQIEEQQSKFKLPKFGISLPEVKGPKIGSSTTKTEIDISLPEEKMEVCPPKLPEGVFEVKAEIPEMDSKGLDVKTKGSSFTFPKFGFSKSEVKSPEADASLPVVGVSLPEGNVDLEGPKTDITLSMGDTEQKDETRFGSPTKFKIPSFTLPKFGVKAPKGTIEISTADVQGKDHDISLPEAELKLSAEPLSVEIKGPDVELEKKSLSVDINSQDIQIEQQGSKFKLPKFGIGLPEVKVPKIDSSTTKAEIDITLPEVKAEGHPPDVKGATQLKADIPEIDSKGLEVKTKGPSFSFPKFGFSKSEMKAPEVDPGLPTVDVSVPEGSIDLKETATVSTGEIKQKEKSKFGSPTKFKLPSITMPKFGAKAPKGPMESSAVDVQAKGPEISLPDAEVKSSTEPLSVEIKGTDVELDKSVSVDIKARNIQTEQQGSKFKLPKFGISLPEVKGPKTKTEIDVSLPEGTMEVCPPDTKLPEGAFEVKAEIPEIDSKGLDVKTKRSSFTFPKFGFSKSEMKATDVDASLPVVDVSLPEGDGNIEGPKTDITLSVGDTEQKDETKFGSPTKFKLPSFTLPKFGAKAPKLKADMPTVDVEVKGHDMSLPDTELSAEPLPADVKVGDINKQDIKKPQDMKTEEQGSSFKLPKFGISLPEVKGTKLAVESSVDVQAKGPEIGLPDTEVKLSTEPLSVEGPHVELDKSLSVEMKPQDIQTKEESSKFKLPKFGIGLPEVKGPKATKAEIDITLPEGKVEVHPPDVKVTEGATELKADMPEIDSKGLEVKTKGPSFSFPKFGFSKSQTKTSEPDVSFQNVGVSVQEGSIHLKGPNVDTAVSISDQEQKEDTRFGSPTKFKLPSISIPKFSSKASKAPVDISAEDIQTKGPEINLSDTELKLPGGPGTDNKQNIPIVDVKAQDIQIEGQGRKFKLPKFGISLPEVKGTKADASASKTELNISLPEETIEVHPPDTTLPEKVIKVKVDSKGLDVISGTKLQIKTPEVDVSLPKADASVHEGTTQPVDTQSQETKDKDNAVVTGSPIKFKLPTFKMPTFGKTSETSADISIPEKDIALCASDKDVKLHDPQAEAEIEDPIQKPTETAVKHEEGGKGSPSRFKLPTIKMSKISISKTKSQDGDNDTSMGVNAPEVILEPKHKKDTQGQGKSSKFTIPTLDDILRGFDVEFNVPTMEETEGAKTEASPVNLKGSLKESEKVADSEASLEISEKQTVLQTDQKPEDEGKQMTNEKSSWFKFPKFSSPTKTAKDVEKESFQPPQETEERSEADNKEREPELSSTRETEEDNISPTLSLRSSDAFGDISSAQTTEQVALSLASPTKVKVKYSESTAAVEISDLHGDVVTSTARTELISMEPHQPEKVNIPWSSEKSSSSVDTQRQMSGEFHIIVSNVQMVPDTQRTTIVTSLDTQDIHSLPLEGVAIQSGSGLSVEGTRVLKEERTVVERRVVKQRFGDDEEKVFVTMRTQVFEGDSVEPITDETASSIQKLRDTVHTEKMRFFESAESNEQNTTSNETSLRHIDSSAEENEGK